MLIINMMIISITAISIAIPQVVLADSKDIIEYDASIANLNGSELAQDDLTDEVAAENIDDSINHSQVYYEGYQDDYASDRPVNNKYVTTRYVSTEVDEGNFAISDNQQYVTDASINTGDSVNLNVFEKRILQDTLDDSLLVKNVPLEAVSPQTLKTFVQVIDLVRRDYVESVSDELLFNNAIAGMLEKLDSHAEFLDADAYDNLRAFTEGDIGHVGIDVEFLDTDAQWVIKEVVPNSPAQLAGFQAGDYLHKVNDIKLNSSMQKIDILQLLTGIAGTLVDVEVSKAGRDKKVVTLQRNVAQKQQLEVEVIGSVVYIKLPVFQNDTAIQMIESLETLDTPITGILIDMRNNPGGVLTSAVEVASLFMEDTEVVQIRGRNKPVKVLSTQGMPILKDLPVVILQNRYSASASEVLASSMQINNRAIITGERSHGKGSIQAILPLDDTQAVKLTVAHYLGADGSEIDGVGVTPDVDLPQNKITLWKQQALALLLEQDRPLGILFNTSQDGIAVEEDY